MKYVKFFAGHTRFATSSKASFDGTHPHQWSKPKYLRVYNMEGGKVVATPENMRVENFISHNGDFDFYELNGKVYEIDAVQEFLEYATETKMPAVVDSAAIAGMMDLIRCKGCFGLSVRYIVCLGLPTSEFPEANQYFQLPKYDEYEKIGEIFEQVLEEMQTITQKSLEDIGSSSDMREALVCKVTEELSKKKKPKCTPTIEITHGERRFFSRKERI